MRIASIPSIQYTHIAQYCICCGLADEQRLKHWHITSPMYPLHTQCMAWPGSGVLNMEQQHLYP